ncbi:MAG: porin family protein [Saprospiraceae bacterium]|nr:porin family protein [Saprospiraceae bacterium]
MKCRIFLTSAILCVVTSLSIAQMELRPFVGGILSQLENTEEIEFEDEWGVNFGVDLMIGGRLYIQPGLHYSGVRNEVKPGGGINGEDTELRVDNFTIPVLAGYRFFDIEENDFFNVRIFTGPSLSFVSSVDDDESQLDIDREDFKSATFGWNAGAGIDFLFAFLDIGYRFGISDIFDDFDVQGIDIENTRNNLLYVNAGIRLKI